MYKPNCNQNCFNPCEPEHCEPNFCEPNFPNFCPDKKFPRPIPCTPPVPSVVEGQSLYECMNNLVKRVNTMGHVYNDVMANCYETLHNLQRSAEENGAYYNNCEVWTEPGYYADESASYYLTHKAPFDRCGKPIKINLHLAYSNTTNSKIEQGLFEASKITYADKIVVAQPKTENGWYGKAIWNCCPIASSEAPQLYTMGFTKNGVMRVYSNGVSTEQMLRDTIENAMGVSGVLIQNGQICDDSWMENIPNRTEQVERVCIGQNTDTMEVIILTCGNENDVNKKGLTSKACANILLSYGCDIAVELCESASAGALDKGSLMFIPQDNNVPTAYAFWYISRKCFYHNDFQKELALLMQNYGRCIWETYLNHERIKCLNDKLNQEIIDRTQADQDLFNKITQEIADRTQADQDLFNKITQEIADRTQAVQDLLDKINQEITDRINGDQTLDNKINTEIANRTQADQVLDNKINDEIAAREQCCQTLTEAIQKEEEERKAEDARINSIILELQNQMAALNEALTQIQITISTIERSIDNIKTLIEQIRSGEIVLPYVRLSGDTMTGALKINADNGLLVTHQTVEDSTADNYTARFIFQSPPNGFVDPYHVDISNKIEVYNEQKPNSKASLNYRALSIVNSSQANQEVQVTPNRVSISYNDRTISLVNERVSTSGQTTGIEIEDSQGSHVVQFSNTENGVIISGVAEPEFSSEVVNKSYMDRFIPKYTSISESVSSPLFTYGANIFGCVYHFLFNFNYGDSDNLTIPLAEMPKLKSALNATLNTYGNNLSNIRFTFSGFIAAGGKMPSNFGSTLSYVKDSNEISFNFSNVSEAISASTLCQLEFTAVPSFS